MANYDDLISKIESLSVVELAELVHKMEEKFGISAAAPVAAGAGAAAAPAEEKDSFTVVLKAAGESKLNVIKVVREVTALGLKEAKDLVDGAPKPVKENVKKEKEREMKEAAKRLDFELAAILRDEIKELSKKINKQHQS